MSYANEPKLQQALRKPFLPKQIGRLPKTAKRPALDYVSHAVVTDRLNFVVPGWTYTIEKEWEIVALEADKNGNPREVRTYWVRGTMTIGDVSRVEYGDGDDPKDAIGNFIRRGAMRFGVGLDLWMKQDGEASASSPPLQEPTPVASGRDGAEERGEGPRDADGEAATRSPDPQTEDRIVIPAPPEGDADKSDLTFHPSKPHRMKPAPDFPGYLMCAVGKCPYWEYVGAKEAS